MMKKLMAVILIMAYMVCAIPVSASLATDVSKSIAADSIIDLKEDNWAYPYVLDMLGIGVMYLDENGNFNPDVPTTRIKFVSALWRTFGWDYVDVTESSFEDISVEDDYIMPVEWAYANKITTGVDDKHFAPDNELTREQAFTFLYRAMVYAGIAPTYDDGHVSDKKITEFNDYNKISSWSADAIQLLMDMGIVTGSDTNEVWPQKSVNNAATATILWKTVEYMDIPAFEEYIGYWMFPDGEILEIDEQDEWEIYDSEGALLGFGYTEYTTNGVWLSLYDGSEYLGRVYFDEDNNLTDGADIFTKISEFPY